MRVGLTRYEGGAEVEPLRDPLRGSVLVVEALRVGGDERDRGLLELRGAAEGADGREATEGLGELREDGRARDGLEPLQVARGGAREPVRDAVDGAEEGQHDEEPG